MITDQRTIAIWLNPIYHPQLEIQVQAYSGDKLFSKVLTITFCVSGVMESPGGEVAAVSAFFIQNTFHSLKNPCKLHHWRCNFFPMRRKNNIYCRQEKSLKLIKSSTCQLENWRSFLTFLPDGNGQAPSAEVDTWWNFKMLGCSHSAEYNVEYCGLGEIRFSSG